MEILRKITIKSCGDFTIKRIKDEIAKAKLADGAALSIIKIAGECTGAKTQQTDKGTYTRLSGSFVGTDLLTGSLYQSGQCILPDFVGSALGAAVLGASGPVQFAFEIQVKRMDTAVTGYSFSVKPLMETKPSASMQALMALAGIEQKAPALPAPEPAKAPAPSGHDPVTEMPPEPAPPGLEGDKEPAPREGGPTPGPKPGSTKRK